MTTQLQKFEKKFILVFTDNTTMQIDQKTKDFIKQNIKQRFINIKGSIYSTHRFGDILTKKEYYDRHPEKLPAPTYNAYEEQYYGVKDYVMNKEKAMKGIIKGLGNYVKKQGKNAKNSAVLLEGLQLKFKQLYN